MMHASYDDIISRIAEKPTWWDENGTPRYGAFAPDACPDIYASDVVLLEIGCQDCDRHFRVEMHYGPWQRMYGTMSLEAAVRDGVIHYGDPPSHGCEGAGDTMNSIPHRVLEFWRHEAFDWKRVPELEVDCFPEWAKDEERGDEAASGERSE